MRRHVQVRMTRLARVLRAPMADAGGVGVAGAGVVAGLRVSRNPGCRRKAVQMSLLLRLRHWKIARRARLKDERLSHVRSGHRVKVDVIVVVGTVAGVIAEDANVAAGNLPAETSGWTRYGSGLRRVVRGQLQRMMRLSI